MEYKAWYARYLARDGWGSKTTSTDDARELRREDEVRHNDPQSRDFDVLREQWRATRLPEEMEALDNVLSGKWMATWLDSRERWGEGLTNFILSEHEVIGQKSPAVRSKISGIRFFHIAS